jgi:hypothetical protein
MTWRSRDRLSLLQAVTSARSTRRFAVHRNPQKILSAIEREPTKYYGRYRPGLVLKSYESRDLNFRHQLKLIPHTRITFDLFCFDCV